MTIFLHPGRPLQNSGLVVSFLLIPGLIHEGHNPSLYLPMALAVTFPINITLGLPLYFAFADDYFNSVLLALL